MYNYFSAVPELVEGTELLVVELVIISVVELVETTDAEGSLYCV